MPKFVYVLFCLFLVYANNAFANLCEGRTLEVQEALEAQGRLPCDQLTEEYAPRIVFLLIGGQNLTELKPDDFQGLPYLSNIQISTNRLQTLPEGLFRNLPNLETISIGGELTSLPEGIFAGLKSLGSLTVSSTALTWLPTAFSDLTSLYHLRIGTGAPLPPNLLRNLKNLDRISLGFAPGVPLPDSQFFAGLNKLKLLDFDGNIEQLPDFIFQELKSINSLNLRQIGLKRLSKDVFFGLENLRELNLDYNELTEIPVGVFEHLKGMRFLTLTFNQIKRIEDSTFTLPILTSIELKANPNLELSPRAFDGLPKLSNLDLSRIGAQTFPPGIFASIIKFGLVTLEENPIPETEKKRLETEYPDVGFRY